MIPLHVLFLVLGCGYLRAQDGTTLNESVQPPPGFTGQWVAWYASGQKKCECRYVEGKPDGKWVYWYDNGVKTTEVDYDKGQVSGHHTTWHKNGKQASQATFENGELTEPWVYWTSEGILRDGTETTFYENGQRKSEEHYIQGKRQGVFIYWNRDGQKQREEHYLNGVPDGVMRYWHDNGVLSSETEFHNGKKHGRQESWYPNGWTEGECVFENGIVVKQVAIPGDDSPKEWGVARAKDDLTKGVRRIYYFGKPWGYGGPPKDEASGLPVEIVAGCDVAPGFPEKIQGYNETMRSAAKEVPQPIVSGDGEPTPQR